ncbi:hypothetical protein MSAN_00965000 [Mycena sanguinolenta]|uniref:Uncharacterized protein n=1 Tax=Mycena sanguinolenta TaxID=230812 RepID=A0A8H6YVB3_9AGAR|nr:hypothetical protein MSAN_00965000 [Mycena sanguinolenta]
MLPTSPLTLLRTHHPAAPDIPLGLFLQPACASGAVIIYWSALLPASASFPPSDLRLRTPLVGVRIPPHAPICCYSLRASSHQANPAAHQILRVPLDLMRCTPTPVSARCFARTAYARGPPLLFSVFTFDAHFPSALPPVAHLFSRLMSRISRKLPSLAAPVIVASSRLAAIALGPRLR